MHLGAGIPASAFLDSSSSVNGLPSCLGSRGVFLGFSTLSPWKGSEGKKPPIFTYLTVLSRLIKQASALGRFLLQNMSGSMSALPRLASSAPVSSLGVVWLGTWAWALKGGSQSRCRTGSSSWRRPLHLPTKRGVSAQWHPPPSFLPGPARASLCGGPAAQCRGTSQPPGSEGAHGAKPEGVTLSHTSILFQTIKPFFFLRDLLAKNSIYFPKASWAQAWVHFGSEREPWATFLPLCQASREKGPSWKMGAISCAHLEPGFWRSILLLHMLPTPQCPDHLKMQKPQHTPGCLRSSSWTWASPFGEAKPWVTSSQPPWCFSSCPSWHLVWGQEWPWPWPWPWPLAHLFSRAFAWLLASWWDRVGLLLIDLSHREASRASTRLMRGSVHIFGVRGALSPATKKGAQCQLQAKS